MRATLKAIRDKLRRMMHVPLPVVGNWLGSMFRGYLNYFAVPGNLFRLSSFREEICRTWRRMAQRRSQRITLPWEWFNKLADRFIPPVRTIHPEARYYVKHSR